MVDSRMAFDGDEPDELTGNIRPWLLSRLVFGSAEADGFVTRKLAEQFRRSLLTDFEAIPRPGDDTPEHATLHDKGIALLKNHDAPWADIDEAEKIKAHILPEGAIDAALERELDEAAGLKINTARMAARVRTPAPDGPDSDEKRQYLGSLVSDVQWERKKRFACRSLRACYVTRVCRMTLIVGPIFFAALIWTTYANNPQSSLYTFIHGNLRYPGLIIAIASGILGAWFSMLVSIDKRLSGLTLDELRVAQRISSLIGRMIFGAAAAVIFYFLLQSGLFDAEILPDVRDIGFEQMNFPAADASTLREMTVSGEIGSNTSSWLPSTDLCLLIIWCVLCGFSEKLIPAALSRNADRVTDRDGEA